MIHYIITFSVKNKLLVTFMIVGLVALGGLFHAENPYRRRS